jgi:hypothetical protein
MKTLPKVNLKELKKRKEENFKQRLEFIDRYSEWLDKQSNKKISKEQKVMIDINQPLKLSSPNKIKYIVKKKKKIQK